jgi:hypothetical protein
MQNDSLVVVGSGLTVTGAELTSELRLTETDLEIDLTLRDAAHNSAGTRIELSSSEGRVLASATVLRAERAAAARDWGVPGAMLRTSAVVTDLRVEDASGPQLAALLYAAARRARILDRVNILLVQADPLTQPATAILRLAPCSEQLTAIVTQRVDLAAHYADTALEAAGQPVAPKLRAQEVAETARRWLSNGREWGLFRAVHARTLTRRQYVYALSNIYQFVRHTTRILARCIAHSDTTEMRSHFIHHLNGEVNHELIIEHDLKNMGEDVGYVCKNMAPNGPTQEFMAIQEALIGYYADPVQLMASPMAAEGVTAHLDQAFVDNLHACMRDWGLKTPEKASKFFVSHMSADGGPDGHWEHTVNFLAKCLVDETKHQFFLRSMRNSMRGTERLYDSFVDDVPSWTNEPAAKTAGSISEAHA